MPPSCAENRGADSLFKARNAQNCLVALCRGARLLWSWHGVLKSADRARKDIKGISSHRLVGTVEIQVLFHPPIQQMDPYQPNLQDSFLRPQRGQNSTYQTACISEFLSSGLFCGCSLGIFLINPIDPEQPDLVSLIQSQDPRNSIV